MVLGVDGRASSFVGVIYWSIYYRTRTQAMLFMLVVSVQKVGDGRIKLPVSFSHEEAGLKGAEE
jgi:hypothetical protein